MENLTKEQIREFQEQQIQEFLKRFNAFLEGEDFTVIAIPFIDNDGRIRARIEVAGK